MTSLHHPDCMEAPVNLEDNAIFDTLYKKYWEQLLIFAGRYIADRDTCKEIVQELFITLHIKRSQLRINISLTAYLYSSMRNKIINHVRKESIYKKHVSVAGKAIHAYSPLNDIDLLMDVNDLQKEICYCLNKMSARQREVYVLVKQDAYPLKKVAEMLNRPVQTVEKQLRKAVLLVQAHLNKRKMHLPALQ